MIDEITTYVVMCDRCSKYYRDKWEHGVHTFDNTEDIEDKLLFDGWVLDRDSHICYNCTTES